MGDKDLFHEPSVKVPLIVYDPSSEADGARHGCDELVESIDLIPTFLEASASTRPASRTARGPLAPSLPARQRSGRMAPLRHREYDYSMLPARRSSASPRATHACSWSPTSAGSWSTPWASGRCSTT
jgi:arylsulfatase A-like enzyme